MAHRLVVVMTEQIRLFKYFTIQAAKTEYGKANAIFVCYFMQEMLVIQQYKHYRKRYVWWKKEKPKSSFYIVILFTVGIRIRKQTHTRRDSNKSFSLKIVELNVVSELAMFLAFLLLPEYKYGSLDVL